MDQIDSVIVPPSPRGGGGGSKPALIRSSSTFNKRDIRKAIVTEDSKYLGSVHSYHEEEKEGLVDYINGLLYNHSSINAKSNDIFESVKDGILLCRVVNAIQPGALDEGRMNIKDKLSIFEKGENLMLALRSAQDAFNMSFVNIGVEDLLEGRPGLVLSILWQLVNRDLRTRVKIHSKEIDYLRIDEPDGAGAEDADISLPEEYKIILRWVNHHLMDAGVDRRVSNFSSDLKDSVAFIVLLHQLAPQVCTLDALNEANLLNRAGLVLQSADLVGCRKFLSPDDIVQGSQQRLNFAFLAYLFTKFNVPAKSAENKIADAKLDAQAIELVDIHKDRKTARDALNKAQDQEKESGQRVAHEKAEAKREEIVLQNRILDLEDTHQKQVELYTAKIETLKQQVVHAQAAKLPSVEELKKAIAVEEAEQQTILKEREVKRIELESLKENVAAKVAVRAREEVQLARVTEEVVVMETEHDIKTKTLSEKIDALGITALQQKLDEAVAQTSVMTTTNAKLSKGRERLVGIVEKENANRSKASSARKRVEEELAKAKKSLDETKGTKVATEAAATRLERKLVDIKNETTKVKKETIFVEYQTTVAKEDTEIVKEQTKEIVLEKESLIETRASLREAIDEIEDEVFERETKTEEEVRELVEANEKTLEINRKKSNVEIEEKKVANDRLSDRLLNVKANLAGKQVEASVKGSIIDVRRDDVRAMQLDIAIMQEEKKEADRVAAALKKQQVFTQSLVKEEMTQKEKEEAEIQMLEKEAERITKAKNNKLSKFEELSASVRVKELEAVNAALLADSVSHLVRGAAPLVQDDVDVDVIVKNKERFLVDEEKKRSQMKQDKKYLISQAINRDKQFYEKRIQQKAHVLSNIPAGGNLGQERIETLQRETEKLKAEGEELARREKLTATQLKAVQIEKAEGREETNKLLREHIHINTQVDEKIRAVENENKQLAHVKK